MLSRRPLFALLPLVVTLCGGGVALPASGAEIAPIFQTLSEYKPRSVPADDSRPGVNRLRNAGFEDADANGSPRGWTVVGLAESTRDPVHSGQRGVCLRNPERPDRGDGRLVQDVLGVPGGASYRTAAFMRATEAPCNLNIKLEVYTAEGTYLGGFRSEHIVVSPGEGWTRVAYTHRLPPMPGLRVTVLYRLWGPGPILIDDASFERVAQEPLYLSPNATGTRLGSTDDLVAWTAPLPARVPENHAVDSALANRWPTGQLDLRLAGNETGLLPVFLSAGLKGLEDVQVSVSFDVGEDAARLNPELFTIDPFCHLGGLYYDVLVPLRPIALRPRTTRMVWLRITMPPGAKRSAARGRLLVARPDAETMSIPLTVTPFAFDLPRIPSLPFCVGIPRPGRRVRPAERSEWLRDIARHRMSIRHLAPPKLTFDGDQPVFDFTAFDAELDLAHGLGMGLFQLPYAYVALGHGSKYRQTFGPIGNDGISDEFRRKFVSAMRVLGGHLEERGVLQRFNHNLFDEPYPDHYPLVRELARLLKEAHPDYRPSVYGLTTAAVAGELAGVIDEPIGAGWNAPARAGLERLGALVTVYNPLQSLDVTRRPELARGLMWWAFRSGIDRVYHWCIGPTGKSMEQHDYGSAWVFLVPGQDAYLPSVRYEMLREGLEDYDYLTLFARRFDDVANNLGVQGVSGTSVANAIAAGLSGSQIMAQSRDGGEYERVRTFLGTAISHLHESPRVLFRASPHARQGTVRLELWLEPGATAKVANATPNVVRGTGTITVRPDATGTIVVDADFGGKTKRLEIPARFLD
jgi:hypothetical protein